MTSFSKQGVLFLFLLIVLVVPTAQAQSTTDFVYSRQLNVSNQNPSAVLPAGYTINFTIDTTGIIASGKLRSDGADMKVFYGSQILDTANMTPFNQANTSIVFKLQANISIGQTDTTHYRLYYGNPSISYQYNNKSNIFVYFEDFNYSTLSTLDTIDTFRNDTTSFVVRNPTSPDGIDTFDSNGFVDAVGGITTYKEVTRYLTGETDFKLSLMLAGKLTGQNGLGVGILNSTSGMKMGFFVNENGSALLTYYNGRGKQTIGTFADLEWYRFDAFVSRNSTNTHFNLSVTSVSENVVNGSPMYTASNQLIIGNNTMSLHNISIIFKHNGGADARVNGVDRLIIQKYMNPEPSVGIGGEASTGLINISIYNEMTETFFNLNTPKLNQTTLTIYCPLKTTNYNVTNASFITSSNCTQPEIRLTMQWSDPAGTVFRTLLPDTTLDSSIENRFYMIDVTNASKTYIFQQIFFNDLSNRYRDGSVQLQKILGDGSHIMIQQNMGAQQDVQFHMIVGDVYQLIVKHPAVDDLTLNSNFKPTDSLTVPIIFGEVSSIPSTAYQIRDIGWIYTANPSIPSISLTYNDTGGLTTSIRFRVINGSDTSITVGDTTLTPTSFPASTSIAVPTVNETYIVRIDVVNTKYGTFSDEHIFTFNGRRLFNIPGVTTQMYNMAALFFILMMGLIITPFHAPIGAFIMSLVAGFFYFAGFMDNMYSFLAIVLIIAISGLGMLVRRQGELA